MRRLRSLLPILALFATTPTSARAQAVQEGTRVRISSTAPALVLKTGTVLAVEPDTVVVHLDDSNEPDKQLRVARADITAIGEWVGRGGHSTELGFVGAAAGAVIGGIIGWGKGDTPRRCSFFGCQDAQRAWEHAVEGGFMGALLLGAVGVGIGTLFVTDLWEPLDPHLVVDAGRSGWTVSASVRLSVGR